MITKLLLKIVFKATLPLFAVVGIASYALYAAGGDPISVFKQVSGGFGDRLSELSSSAGSSINSARNKTTSAFSSDDAEAGSSQTLYRWKDADGVTHFSSTPPDDGVKADALKVDPNRNLMSAAKKKNNEAKASRVSQTEEGLPENMPGVAGILTPGMNPADLINQFKQIQETQQGRIP